MRQTPSSLPRKIFSNLEIDQQKTILFEIKEPFQTLIQKPNYGQISFGERCTERLDAVSDIKARLCGVVDWLFGNRITIQSRNINYALENRLS